MNESEFIDAYCSECNSCPVIIDKVADCIVAKKAWEEYCLMNGEYERQG